MSGPVSSLVEQEILGELRRKGIVVWLDRDGSYSHFVDDLALRHAAGAFPFVPARALRQRSRKDAAADPHAGLDRGDDSDDAGARAVRGRRSLPHDPGR